MYAPVASILSAVLLLGGPAADENAGAPFDTAGIAPRDVTVFVQLEQGGHVRRNLAARPVARFFDRLLTAGNLQEAWHRLAAHARVDDAALLDLWLGRRCTLLIRRGGDGSDWALLTEVERDTAADIIKRLEPKRLAPRWGLPVAELPEHGLLVAADGSQYVIGPIAPGRLFDQTLRCLAGDELAFQSLASDPAMKQAHTLGNGCMQVFMRHEPPLGGWSAVVADLDGDQLNLRHLGRFETAPFQRPVTRLQIDLAPLKAFRDHALLAFIEPIDVTDGPFTGFLEAMLGEPLVSEAMRRNFRDVQIITVGEVEGRGEPHRTDMRLPTLAVAVRAEHADEAEAQLDAHAADLIHAVNRLGEGTSTVCIPDVNLWKPGQPRHVDLQPAIRAFADDFPLMRSVSLDWTVSNGSLGDFYVVATHPQELQEVVRALNAAPSGDEDPRCWTNCGFLNGRRIAVHLHSYCEQVVALAAEDPEEVVALRDTLLTAADLARGIEFCEWRARRRSATVLELEIELTLSRPDSAERP